MKLKGWVVAAALVGGTVVASRGCLNQRSPDEKLAVHFEALCSVARDNVDQPEKGVEELGRFFAKHAPTMLSDLGDTIVMIEKVSDDRKHDERARLARDRIQAPMIACRRDWQRFANAVEGNRAAKQKLDRAMIRLNRTFEILFGGKQLELATLPAQLANGLGDEP